MMLAIFVAIGMSFVGLAAYRWGYSDGKAEGYLAAVRDWVTDLED